MGKFDKLIGHMERKLESLRQSNDVPKSMEPLKLTNDQNSKGGLKVIKVKAIKGTDKKFKKTNRKKKC